MRFPPNNKSLQPTADETRSTTQTAAETRTPGERLHSIPWVGLIAWPAVVLIVYAISFGPVLMMVDRGVLSQRSLALYWPVVWAYDNTALHKPIGLYIHFWVPGATDEKGEHF